MIRNIPPIILAAANELLTSNKPLWGKIGENKYIFSSTKCNYETEGMRREAYAKCFRDPNTWTSWNEYVEQRYDVSIQLKNKKDINFNFSGLFG